MLQNDTSIFKDKRGKWTKDEQVVAHVDEISLGIVLMKRSWREDVVKNDLEYWMRGISRMIEGVVTIYLAGVIKRLIERTLAWSIG